MRSERRVPESLLATGESLLALLAAVGLTLALTLPLVSVTAEYVLIWSRGSSKPAFDELVRRLEDRGLGKSVEIVGDADAGVGTRLIVSGLSLIDAARNEIRVVADQVGFETTRPSYLPSPMERVLEDSGRLVFSVQALSFIVVGGILIRARVERSRPGTKADLRHVLVLGLLGGVGAFVLSVTIGFVMSLVGLPVEEQEWARKLLQDRNRLLGLLPWIVLIVPFSEEVFFRGYVLRFLAERAGRPTGFVISTLLFALIHFNPTGIVVYLSIGAVLAYVYLRTRSLLAPVLAHVIHNSLVLVPALLGT